MLLRALKRSDDALLTAEKLKQALDEAFFVDTQVVNVGASIRVSVYPDDADDLTALLRHADSTMYHVKNSGKNGVKRYHAIVDAALEEHKRLERNLRQALIRDELQLFYQPLFDLHSGRLVKAEALLRWRHPERGWIPPATFVPLDDWVVQNATRQAHGWQLAGLVPVRVSVNVSPLQFAQPQFGGSVVEALTRSQLEAHFLELERPKALSCATPRSSGATSARCSSSASPLPSTTLAPATRPCRTCATSPSTPSRSTARSSAT